MGNSNTMRAQRLEDGSIGVTGRERAIVFERMEAGVGWPDLEPGYVLVVGERLDGLYHCLWERQGGLWELGSAAREARENFLVDRVWVDGSDSVSTSYLRTLNGLCFQEKSAQTVGQRIIGRTGFTARLPPTTEEHPISVALIQEAVAVNFRSSLERTREVVMTGRIMIHEGNCPRLTYMLRQPLEAMLKSPVIKGLVWVVSALELTGNSSAEPAAPRAPWYANPPR